MASLMVSRDLRSGSVGERIDALVVEDDVEGLAIVETGEDLQGRLANLRELLPAHAAGAVDDERHLALQARRIGLGRPGRQAGQEQEVASADLGVGVSEQRGRDIGSLAEERQTERTGLGPGVGSELDGRHVRPSDGRSAAGGWASRSRRSALST